ncbi:MAG: flippase [Candidatus Omnitrophota bacterium]
MKKLSKNFLWMASANLTCGLLNIAMYIYLARKLGAGRFGKFSFVQALVFYLFNFIDLGLSTFGTREIAKDTSRLRQFVDQIISLRLIIAFLLYAVFVLLTLVSKEIPEIKALMLLTALWFFSYAAATEWAFQGLEKMQMVFISLVATVSLQFLAVLFLVNNDNYYYALPGVLVLATLPIAAIYLRILLFRPQFFNIDFKALKIFFSSALVIWAISLFAQVYNGFDVVLMGALRSPAETGYFTVARRFTGGLTFISIFLANAALPRYANALSRGKGQCKKITLDFLKIVVSTALGLFVLIIVFCREIILLTVGAEYLAAEGVLKILMVGVALVFVNLPFSTALIAASREKAVLKQALSSAALNVSLNLFLIPKWGMEGAAWSFVAAEVLALTWVVGLYKRSLLTVMSSP